MTYEPGNARDIDPMVRYLGIDPARVVASSFSARVQVGGKIYWTEVLGTDEEGFVETRKRSRDLTSKEALSVATYLQD